MSTSILFPFTQNSNQSVNIISSYTKFGYIKDNREYLDISLGNSGCFMLGFDRKDILESVYNKCKEIPFISGEFFTTNKYILELTDKLSQISNGFKSFYSVSGSDANEGAVKAAALYHVSQGNLNKKIILGISESYHGCTYLTSSISALQPMTVALGSSNMCQQITRNTDGNVLLKNIKSKINELGSSNISCLVIESCSYLGGLTPYNQDFWKSLRNLCTENNILLIIDDIAMCGGKTGKILSFDIMPDIFTMGKALSGGYFPLSVTLISPMIFNSIKNERWMHGFTYSFNCSGIYSALEYLNIIEKENILKNYNNILANAILLFNRLVDQRIIASYTNNGLYFNLKFHPISNYNQIESHFSKYGLNIGPDNFKWKGLRVIVPLVADDKYFEMLETNLSLALTYLEQ